MDEADTLDRHAAKRALKYAQNLPIILQNSMFASKSGCTSSSGGAVNLALFSTAIETLQDGIIALIASRGITIELHNKKYAQTDAVHRSLPLLATLHLYVFCVLKEMVGNWILASKYRFVTPLLLFRALAIDDP